MKIDREYLNDEKTRMEMLVESLLRYCMSSDYTRAVRENIFEDVRSDVLECADKNYTIDDVKLAIGRTLTDRLGIER